MKKLILILTFLILITSVFGAEDLVTSGKLGVGLSSPAFNLDVKSNEGRAIFRLQTVGEESLDHTEIIQRVRNTDASNWILFGDSEPGYKGYIRYAHSIDSMFIASGGENTLVLDKDQNVGIGINSPKSKLHINSEDGHLLLTDFGGNSLNLGLFDGEDAFGIESNSDLIVSSEDDMVFIGNEHLFFDLDDSNNPILNIGEGKIGVNTKNPQAQFEINTEDTGTVFLIQDPDLKNFKIDFIRQGIVLGTNNNFFLDAEKDLVASANRGIRLSGGNISLLTKLGDFDLTVGGDSDINSDSLRINVEDNFDLFANDFFVDIEDDITFRSEGEFTISTDRDFFLSSEDIEVDSDFDINIVAGDELELSGLSEIVLDSRGAFLVIGGNDNISSVSINREDNLPGEESLHMDGNLRIDNGKVLMSSEDGTLFRCGPNNSGNWVCE